MEENRCSVCGSVVNPGDTFCPNCGTPVPPSVQEAAPAQPEAPAQETAPVQPEAPVTPDPAAAQETTVLNNPFSLQDGGQPMPADAGTVYPAGSAGMDGGYQAMPGSGAETSYQGSYSAYATVNTAEPVKKPGKGLGIAALILSILGFLTSCIGVGFVFGLVGLILGIVCLAKKGSKGLGVTSVILGALGTLVGIVMLVLLLVSGASLSDSLSRYTGSGGGTVSSTNEMLVNGVSYSLPDSLSNLNLTVNETYSSTIVSEIETYGLAAGEYEFVLLDTGYGCQVWGYIENTGYDTVYSVDDLEVTGLNADNYSGLGITDAEVYGGVTLGMSRSEVESAIGTADSVNTSGYDVYESSDGSVVLRIEYDSSDYVTALDITIY